MPSSNAQRLLFLLLLLLLAGIPSSVYALQFNAYWSYRESGSDNTDTTKQFLQRYSLGVGPALTYRPTHAITASAAVGYTQSQQEAGDGWQSSQALTPSARVNLVNDIFQASLSGTTGYTDRASSGFERGNSWWESSIASMWDIPLWPQLVLSYSESYESEGADQQNTNFTFNWDLILAQLTGRAGNNKAEADNIRTDSNFYNIQLDTSGKFWDNRLGFIFSQRFQKNDTDISFSGQGDGFFDFPLEGQTSSAVTDPVTGPDPEDVELDINPQLGDGDFDAVALVVEPDQRANLGISLEFTEEISNLRLTLDPFTRLTEDEALALHWSLYIRNPFDTGWDLKTVDVPFIYDAVEKRFELGLDMVGAEIMVVAVNELETSLDITELEVFSLLGGDTSTKLTAYLTNFGMNMELTRTLRASFNLSLDHGERDAGENNFKNDTRSVSGNLRWSPVAFMTPALGYSESRYELTDQPDEINRVYSLTVPINALPSLNVSLGATLNERYSDDQKTYTSTRYNLNTRGVLYPDLNASWNLTYQEDETLQTDGQVLNSNAVSSRLDLRAQLYRDLFADIITSYGYREFETGTFQGGDASLGLRYRPSDMLALRGTYTTYLGDNLSDDRLNLILNLTLINNFKSRLGFNANYVRATTQSTLFTMTWNWNISRYFVLVSSAGYRIGDTKSYNFVTALSFGL